MTEKFVIGNDLGVDHIVTFNTYDPHNEDINYYVKSQITTIINSNNIYVHIYIEQPWVV